MVWFTTILQSFVIFLIYTSELKIIIDILLLAHIDARIPNLVVDDSLKEWRYWGNSNRILILKLRSIILVYVLFFGVINSD